MERPPASLVAHWWPLAALLALAAALRLSTLGLQSLWYDEAFGPVHVFHASLVATLEQVPHTENTPPLWYVLEWVAIRIAGDGAVALRFISALAGVGTVALAWGIGRELTGRRAAILAAALAATSPLFVWYSQEARAYGLFTFFCALSLWCFVRAERDTSARRVAAFALASALALLTHYFAVFLVVPMALWLCVRGERAARARGLASLFAIGVVGAALLPLALAQGGRGAEWIGRLTLASRLESIPQYYLTGYSGGRPLGHAIELAVAAPLIAGVLYGLWRVPSARESRAAGLALAVTACGVLLPLVLVPFGADYMDPRNLIGAMVPLTALLAVVIGTRRAGRVGMALGWVAVAAFLAVTIYVERTPRLQRGNWSGVANVLRRPASPARASVAPEGVRGEAALRALAGALGERVIATVHLGSAPLEYYLPGLRGQRAGTVVRAREIDEVGYPRFAADAQSPPVAGFRPAGRAEVDGLFVYRFVAPTARAVAVSALVAHPITIGEGLPQVLAVPPPGPPVGG